MNLTHDPLKPMVYIAGPISTHGNWARNARKGARAWITLVEAGLCTPFLPHVSVYIELMFDTEYGLYMTYDLEVISRCDALLRLPGKSRGADIEESHARTIGIPVFNDIESLHAWCRMRMNGAVT